MKNEDTPVQEPEKEEFDYGWRFQRGPLVAALIITVIFYIIIFSLVPRFERQRKADLFSAEPPVGADTAMPSPETDTKSTD